jgi:hypothetical protein
VTEGPRHLNDETAMFPAVPSTPRHAARDTGEVPAQRPPVPMKRYVEGGDNIHAPFGQWSLRPEPDLPPPATPTRAETRKARRKPRWWRILLGE